MLEEHDYRIPNFETESGVVLPEARVVYGTAGTLNEDRSNAILLPSHFMGDIRASEWAVGPGAALDPAEHFIVATELFGNGRSSSPSTTAAPFDGPRFPVTTIGDNVAAVHALLTEELGIDHLLAVVGMSMGAMQAFQWAVTHPDFMDRVVALSGTAKSYFHGNVRLEAQIAAITTDAAFAGGEYQTPPQAGLSCFGIAWAPWLYSQRWWRDQLWLEADPDSTYEDVVERFRTDFLPGADANDLILQCRTWQAHDVGGPNSPFAGHTDAALRSIRAEVLYMPSETDLYFPLYDAQQESEQIPGVTLTPIPSLWGHPAGAGPNPADKEFVHSNVGSFLRRPSTSSGSRNAEPSPVPVSGVDDAGAYLETIAALVGAVARVSVGTIDDATRADIGARFDLALAAIDQRSIPGLHQHGQAVIAAVINACPNRQLVAAIREGLDEAIDRFTRAPIAGVADWDLLAVRYRDLWSAIDAGDPDRVTAAIDMLYQLPSDAAT